MTSRLLVLLACLVPLGLVQAALAQPKAQPKSAQPKATLNAQQCAQENDRLRRALAAVKIEVDVPAETQIWDRPRVRLSGTLPNVGAVTIYAVVAVPGWVALDPAEGTDVFHLQVSAPGEPSDRWDGFGKTFALSERRAYVALSLTSDGPQNFANSELVLRPRRSGSIELKIAMLAKSGCGERVVGEIAQRTVTVAPHPATTALSGPGLQQCEREGDLLGRIASAFAVDVQAPARLAVGDSIGVTWRRGSEAFPLDRPAYIVFTMPESVRFAGRNIIVVPPRARAPGGVTAGQDDMRVLVPLAGPRTPDAGSFNIKSYRAGPLAISYSFVTKTACGERVHAGPVSKSFDVDAGRAEVVIQDFFAVEKPEKVIVSENGRYRLDVFPTVWAVYDTATGTRLAERAGRTPNFSPGSRFVAAYATGNENIGGDMELFDLVAERFVPFGLQGPTLAWALGDSILIEGTFGHPEIRLRQAMIDPEFKAEAGAAPDDPKTEAGMLAIMSSGRGSTAWEQLRFRLYPDQGAVLFAHTSIGANDDCCWLGDLATRWQTGRTRLTSGELREALPEYGIMAADKPVAWDTGDRLTLSHVSPSTDARYAGDAKVRNEYRAETQQDYVPQQRFFFEHKGQRTQPATAITTAADGAAMRSAGEWRVAMANARSLSAPSAVDRQFAVQLSVYGFCALPGCTDAGTVEVPRDWVAKTEMIQAPFAYGHRTSLTATAQDIERRLVADVPAARAHLTNTPGCYYQDEPKVKFSLRAAREGGADVHGLWSWTTGKTKFWLVQNLCMHAGSMESPLLLFRNVPGQKGAMLDLTDGLHKDFKEGTPIASLTRVRPTIVDERWLLIASPMARAVAVVDLEDADKPVYIRELHDTHSLDRVFWSQDRQHIIQLNTNGRFFIHRTSDGVLAISGRWIDDELVFFTDAGYFSGSYEGGHFVHLRFAGEQGLFSLAQFEKTLRRPNVAELLLGSAGALPPPRINVPPSVDMELESGPAGIALKLALDAAAGLKTLRVFEDGELIVEKGVAGRRVETTVTINRSIRGRWLTAVVEDQTGLLSQPVSVQPRARGGSEGRLQAVLVGVDAYAEPRLKLNYARSDAQRLAEALRKRRGGYYGAVDAETLLDEAAKPDAILRAVETAVQRVKPGDTLVFGFAGHGVRGRDGKFYLTAAGFRSDDVEGTGLAWSKLADALGRSPVRTILFLDACHSGLADSQGIATNDEAVGDLLTGHKSPLLVFAASKGRQFSFEDKKDQPPRWGGGVFTHALVQALDRDWKAFDGNNNDALEVSELYRAVKSIVVKETGGNQTPWLVRKDLLGDFSIF